MNAQLAYEYAEEARYQSTLDAADAFDAFVADLSKVPAFVDEALAEPLRPFAREMWLDRVRDAYISGGDVAAVIDDACSAFAEAQTKGLRNALKDYGEIVAEWTAFQRQRDALRGAA